MKGFKIIAIIFGAIFVANVCLAGVLPRFASLKSSEVNLRAGPSKNYPIKWVIRNKGEPVEVITEFEQWREIKDKDGDNGWVHENMLSGSRSVVIIDNTIQSLYRDSDGKKKIAKIEPGSRAKLLTCKNEWCYISVDNYKGWVARDTLWGVYKDERFD
jgi:SH3-like domain-containing protein